METLGSIRSAIRGAVCLLAICVMMCSGAVSARDKNLSVGNKNTRAYFSHQGKWLGVFPSWARGGSLFENGGFIVIARDKNGTQSVIVNTADEKLLSLQGEGKTSIICCEGMEGGNRAPSLNPDDDSDGRINEDKFDGIDNDGDGRVDEDFAAIGDEMVVSEYETRGAANPKLKFHQENYAWAHSHIEGMIAIRLWIENAGTAPVEDVRIGAFLLKEGPFSLSEELFTNRADSQMEPQRAHAVVCASPAGPAVALLFPDLVMEGADRVGTAWRTWSTLPGEAVAACMDRMMSDETDNMTGYGLSMHQELPAAGKLLTQSAQKKEHVFFGGLSPSVGNLEPGESVEVTIFLVAIQNMESIDRTLINAHLTYVGNGTNRFIPPPVPVTPFAVWGNYEKIDEPDEGLLITLENGQAKSIDFNRVSFISGVDRNDVDITNTVSGETEVRIFGQSAARLLQKTGERIVLKGREDSGEFFDAILNPGRSVYASPSSGIESAEAFLNTPGKLSEELLIGSPNPFREQTSVFYEVPTVLETEDGKELKFWGTAETSLKVYDVTGRLVNVLLDETKATGRYRIDWHATDENDNPIASGVYYIKLQIGKRYITKRLLLLK